MSLLYLHDIYPSLIMLIFVPCFSLLNRHFNIHDRGIACGITLCDRVHQIYRNQQLSRHVPRGWIN